MIEAYAKYLDRVGIEGNRDLKAIITTSEVLHESQRHFFQKIFRTKVYNEYGCGEVGSVAHECEHGSMHISAENMIVEILDGDRQCRPGEIGEIVVTELNNDVFPLLRYRLGDFATISYRSCTCGRNLPIIENIKGRAYDIIITDDGRSFHGEFFMYIFEEVERKNYGVAKFQVRQLAINDILVKIVPSSKYRRAEVENMVTGYSKKHLGENVAIRYEIVDEIPREKSGKMRIIVGME
jgi:phenylacetate-CoA ligase